jgi:STE24 endopeptidase
MDVRSNAENMQSREKRYNAIKFRVEITGIVLNLSVIAVLAFSGISPFILSLAGRLADNDYLAFLIFIIIVGAVFSIPGFPLDFYSGYAVEHRFNLSNQTVVAWFIEKAKGAAVGIAIGVPVALAFYFFLRVTGWFWWLYFSVFMFLVSVLLARVAPVLLFPLFYKHKELELGEIKQKISALLEQQGMAFKGIYSFNLSKDTKKANAGFTGIGSSRRIILSDTLIEKFTPDEIAVVFAHELGHYKKRHILKSILYGAASIFLSLFLCGELYRLTLVRFGYAHAYDIAAVPILLFYLSLFALFTTPLSNVLSRAHEREADRYALELTRDNASFISAMEKLADLNLAERSPHPAKEFFFYSHPSIRKRIDFARTHAVK